MKYLITLFCLMGSISLYANTEMSSNTTNQSSKEFQAVLSPSQQKGIIGNTIVSQHESSFAEIGEDILRENNRNQTIKSALRKTGIDEVPTKDGVGDTQKEAGDGYIGGKTCWPIINEDGKEECLTFKELIK